MRRFDLSRRRAARLHETEVGARVRNVGDEVVGDEVVVSFGKHAQRKYDELDPPPQTKFKAQFNETDVPCSWHP